MAERTDEWPRVHTCLHNWCPSKNDECERCDAVIRLMIEGDAGRKTHPPQESRPE